MANEYRVSWDGLEVVHDGAAQGRVTFIGVEVVRDITSQPTKAQVTGIYLEVVRSLDLPSTWRPKIRHIGA